MTSVRNRSQALLCRPLRWTARRCPTYARAASNTSSSAEGSVADGRAQPMTKELVKPTRGRQKPTQNTMKCSWRKLQSLATEPGCSSLARRTEGSHRLVPHPCRRSASGTRYRRHLRPRMRCALPFGLACGISLNHAHALHKPKANDIKKTQIELGRTTVDDFSVFC